MPPAAFRAARRRPKWVWRNSSAALGSSDVDSSVEPTMSVNRMVTVWCSTCTEIPVYLWCRMLDRRDSGATKNDPAY